MTVADAERAQVVAEVGPPKWLSQQTIPTRALRALNGCTQDPYAAAKSAIHEQGPALALQLNLAVGRPSS